MLSKKIMYKRNIFLFSLLIIIFNFISCINYNFFLSWNAYSKGIKAEKKGDIDLAINYYLKDIKKYPIKIRSRLALADVFYTKAYIKKKKGIDLISDWRNSLITNKIAYEIESDTNRKNALIASYINIINKKIDEKNYTEAVMYLDEGSQFSKDNRILKVLKAKVYFYMDKFDSEIEEYKLILSKEPTNEIALNNLGILFLNKKEYKTAKNYLLKAYNSNQRSLYLNKNLGYIYIMEKKYDVAKKYFLKALEVNKNDIDCLNNIAYCYSKTGDYFLALKNYEYAIELTPIDSDIFYNLGNMFYEQENYNKAIENYQKALLMDEDNFDALVNLASAYQKHEQIDKAISTFEKIILIKKNFGPAYENLVYLYKEYRNNQVMVSYYLSQCKIVSPGSYENILKYVN